MIYAKARKLVFWCSSDLEVNVFRSAPIIFNYVGSVRLDGGQVDAALLQTSDALPAATNISAPRVHSP